MEVPEVNGFVPNGNGGAAAHKNALTVVNKSVNDALKRDFNQQVERRMNFVGSPKTVEPSQLDEWLASWGIAYTLFAMGCQKVTTWGIEDVAN